MSLIIALRVDTSNPVHSRVSVFTSGKQYGIETSQVAYSGQLTINTELLQEFVEACNADWFTWAEAGPPPKWVQDHPMFKKE